MAFYSSLFPSGHQEELSGQRTWFYPGPSPAGDHKTRVLRGNKLIRSSEPEHAPMSAFPDLFSDIRMDRIVEAVLWREADADLKAVFCRLCPDADTVLYRHEVMRALEREELRAAFADFHRSIQSALRLLQYGDQAHHEAQRHKYAVDGAALYCDAIDRLLERAAPHEIPSRALSGFLAALREYARQSAYGAMRERVRRAKARIERISYSVQVGEGSVQVEFDAEGDDYLRDIIEAFDCAARWGMDMNPERRAIKPFAQVELSPLESLIVDALARRYAHAFEELRDAAQSLPIVPEPFIARFSGELRFYFQYMEFMGRMRAKGFSFVYPSLSDDGSVSIRGAYDLALALDCEHVVPNDFFLTAQENGAVVTGANQGGKTTFARSIAQAALLCALGLPVPCESARLPLYSGILSQFSQAEDAATDQGKLLEELARLKPILRGAGAGCLVILNELFSSATAQDALDMAGHALGLLARAGAHVVCVTHIHGLAVERMVSMRAQVDPASHARLYRIVRAAGGGNAYADGIAAKYGLSYRRIKERIADGI